MKKVDIQVIRASLVLDKICQNKLNYTEEICNDLSSNETIENEVQRHVTDYEALKGSLSLAPK